MTAPIRTPSPWHISVGKDLCRDLKEQWPQAILGPDGELICTLPKHRQSAEKDETARALAWADARAIRTAVDFLPALIRLLERFSASDDIIAYGARSRGKWSDYKLLLSTTRLTLTQLSQSLQGHGGFDRAAPPMMSGEQT